MDSLRQDVRWALRSLRRRPGFAAVVVATLALGVGANTAVFGVLNAALLKPLPYAEPDRLMRLYTTDRDEPGDREPIALPAAVHFRDHARTLEIGVFYNYRSEGVDLTGGEAPERARMMRVSADYFRVLRAAPIFGRTFTREEERPADGGRRVALVPAEARLVVVSERIFRRYLGSDTGALGSTLRIDGEPYTVIGVMESEFADPVEGEVDVWLPLPMAEGAGSWFNHYLSAYARLAPGATVEAARRELAELARQQGEIAPEVADETALLVPLQADIIGDADTMLLVVMAAVGLLLLIACVNVANLSLARGEARASELAVRSALGSPRGRLVRQLLAESLILATGGGLVGLAVAWLLSDALVGLAPVELLPSSFSAIDGRVFAFSLAIALLSGVLFGVAPAFRFTRPGLERVLREGGRSGAAGRAEARAKSLLVVAEFSLALMLLIGAGVLILSFDRLQRVELNIEPDRVLTFEVHLPWARYSDAGHRARFHQELNRRIAAMPGSRAVGSVSRLPANGNYHGWGTRRAVGDSAVEVGSPSVGANQRVVEGDYFGALRIPLLRGRVFGPEDREDVGRTAVVNQAFARALFPDDDAIGRRIQGPDFNAEIIGIVADVPVTARGDVEPKVYHPHAQFAFNRNWALTQVVSLRGEPAGFLESARRELAAIDPALVLYDPRPLGEVIGRGVAQDRFAMLLLTTFATLAVLLAAIGIYGVLAYSVSRRRAEIGIRMALGASAADVQRMVVGQGGRLAVAGIAIGLVGAALLTRALSSLVFEVSVTNPFVFAAATLILAAVALAASAIPAFQATRVNPLESLRPD
ncbi:MAG: ABC transporter permease [Longimicrobiales bacterium]